MPRDGCRATTVVSLAEGSHRLAGQVRGTGRPPARVLAGREGCGRHPVPPPQPGHQGPCAFCRDSARSRTETKEGQERGIVAEMSSLCGGPTPAAHSMRVIDPQARPRGTRLLGVAAALESPSAPDEVCLPDPPPRGPPPRRPHPRRGPPAPRATSASPQPRRTTSVCSGGGARGAPTSPPLGRSQVHLGLPRTSLGYRFLPVSSPDQVKRLFQNLL